jgi:hypothetical protein
MSKTKFYIDLKEGRSKTETKEFTSKQGYDKALARIRKDKKAKIVEHGKYGRNGERVAVDDGPPKLLGAFDTVNSRMSETKTGVLVQSNFNPKVKMYQSRLYGGLFDMYKVVEPDGTTTLYGQDIGSRQKDGTFKTTDGRTFDTMGWPVTK